MTDDGTITNRMLLEHMQAGDNALKQELKELKKEVQQGFQKVDLQLQEAKEHREAIQEDLDATIKMQASHEQELAMLSGRPQPENY
jgi:hypothetical protein